MAGRSAGWPPGASWRRTLAALGAAGLWSGASEFVRNEPLLPSVWRDHDQGMGLTFPAEPLNAAVWVVWSFGFAATTAIAWVAAFPMMWLVTWNLDVLPLAILPVAVLLSLLEAFGTAWLCLRLAPPTAR